MLSYLEACTWEKNIILRKCLVWMPCRHVGCQAIFSKTCWNKLILINFKQLWSTLSKFSWTDTQTILKNNLKIIYINKMNINTHRHTYIPRCMFLYIQRAIYFLEFYVIVRTRVIGNLIPKSYWVQFLFSWQLINMVS